MTYAYIRVSTETQTVENQRHEIETRGHQVDQWVDEVKSGTVDFRKRDLQKLLKKLQPGDTLICSELSRLGRSLFMIIEILNILLKKKVKLITIKENFILDDSINSKVISFAFGLSAEIERNLISQRTKEGLALRKAQGIHIGRPKGAKNKHNKMDVHYDRICKWRKQGKNRRYIQKRLHCHFYTLKRYMELRQIA